MSLIPTSEATNILQPVGVNLAVNILDRMVHHHMLKPIQALLRFERITVKRRPGLNVLAYFRMNGGFLPVRSDACRTCPATLQDAMTAALSFPP